MASETFPLGWIEPEKRTLDQHEAHDSAVAAMPKLAMPSFGGTPPKGTKILLSDMWSHPDVVKALGFAFTGFYQYTGSCVGVGGGNTCFTVTCVDVLRNKEPEKLVMPAWWFNYGQSRKRAGMRGQGEGSFGSTFAASVVEDGVCDGLAAGFGFPDVKQSGQINIGRQSELLWSDGNYAKQIVIEEAKKRPIRTVTPVNDGVSVRDAILSGYPCTRAGMTFCNPGSASVRSGALVGSQNGRGGHQESWIGYWHHEQLGELIWEHNQWGKDVYGTDPGGGPGGGCWISLDAVDRFCKSQYAEVYAFSQYEGYPAQPELYDWVNNSFFS
jgi:hypothetical protein